MPEVENVPDPAFLPTTFAATTENTNVQSTNVIGTSDQTDIVNITIVGTPTA